MFIQYGVKLLGVVYLALGILGFLPLEVLNPIHAEGHGFHYLLNFIAIDALHNIVHLVLGLTALWASRTLVNAQRWGKVAGVTLLVLFAIGMLQAIAEGFPIDQLLLGLVALNSPGHTLHLVTGAVALYLGLARPLPSPSVAG